MKCKLWICLINNHVSNHMVYLVPYIILAYYFKHFESDLWNDLHELSFMMLLFKWIGFNDAFIFCKALHFITHWGRVTHIYVSKLTTIGSDNDLSLGRRQAIISTSAGILLTGPWGTNFSEISIGIQTFFIQENAFEDVAWKMAAILSRSQCVKSACSRSLTYSSLSVPTSNQSINVGQWFSLPTGFSWNINK